jgi:hypothetical protein
VFARSRLRARDRPRNTVGDDREAAHPLAAGVTVFELAGVTVFELAKIMGSSVRMIERHSGALLDGAGAGISGRLDALEAQFEQADEAQL